MLILNYSRACVNTCICFQTYLISGCWHLTCSINSKIQRWEIWPKQILIWPKVLDFLIVMADRVCNVSAICREKITQAKSLSTFQLSWNVSKHSTNASYPNEDLSKIVCWTLTKLLWCLQMGIKSRTIGLSGVIIVIALWLEHKRTWWNSQ